MKFFGVLSTVLVASSLAGSLGYSDQTAVYQPVSVQMTLQEAQEQIGAQKHIIYREKQAYKIAKQNRDNSVHLTKDFFLEVGAAAGAGWFFTRAWRNTNGLC